MITGTESRSFRHSATSESDGAAGQLRLQIIRADHCGNVARLRNLGAATGIGAFIAFLGSDDLWQARKADECARFVEARR